MNTKDIVLFAYIYQELAYFVLQQSFGGRRSRRTEA